MSLPWFPFYADAYTGDTGHLTCEEHGAYLQLMLAYYRSEKPLPGADRALASLVKLPMERWMECKPALAPFFRAEAGFWHHDRIEEEIKARLSKHAASTAKAKKAAAASHAKRSNKPATSTTSSSATSQPEASLKPAHLHLQLHPPSGGEEAPPPKVASQDLGSQIDPLFVAEGEAVLRATAAGLNSDEIDRERRKFVANHQAKGSFSDDWNASFETWIEREIAFRARAAAAAKSRAPPRVEVNSIPDWDQACVSWVKLQRWPSKGMGGEPGTVACRCPPEILTKHGIDPVTGFKLKVQA